MKKLTIAIILGLLSIGCFAQQDEYKATIFGIRSDGITDNTASIQRAVDFISEKGGGKLVFYVGRYFTGSVELKDNVTIDLREAAVLVGATNIYYYKGAPALLWAKDRKGVGVIGKGVIEGRHAALKANIEDQKAKGYLSENVDIPALTSFVGCEDAVLGPEVKLIENIVTK